MLCEFDHSVLGSVFVMFELKGNRLALYCDFYRYTSHNLSCKEKDFCMRMIVGKSAEDFAHVSYEHQHTFDGGLLNQYIKTGGSELSTLMDLQEKEDSNLIVCNT